MAWLDVCIYRWVDQHKHVRKVCDPYIHLKWINKNKIIIFQPTHSSSRSQVAEASSSSWGNLPWTGLPSSTGCTHTHIQSNQDNLDTSVNPKCTSVRCGTKSDSPPKIHTDMGRTCKHHKNSDSHKESFPPSSTLYQNNSEWNIIISKDRTSCTPLVEAWSAWQGEDCTDLPAHMEYYVLFAVPWKEALSDCNLCRGERQGKLEIKGAIKYGLCSTWITEGLGGGCNMATVLKHLKTFPCRIFCVVPLVVSIFQGYSMMIQWQMGIGTQIS